MDINFFKNNLQKYAGYYNANSLFEKLKGASRKMGIKVVYAALILYYATFDKDLPAKDRLMVLAALGYLILPLDIIPDALPGGFTDDLGALTFVLRQIWSNLSPETFSKAKSRLREWFGNVSDADLNIPGMG